MIKESKAMKELHEIREKLYEKRRHMSKEEAIEDINETAEKFMKEHHLKLKRLQRKTVGV